MTSLGVAAAHRIWKSEHGLIELIRRFGLLLRSASSEWMEQYLPLVEGLVTELLAV